MILLLGDDHLMITNDRPNIKGLAGYIATRFNMESSESYNEDHGTFCQMVSYKSIN